MKKERFITVSRIEFMTKGEEMKKACSLFFVLFLSTLALYAREPGKNQKSAEEMLRDFAASYQQKTVKKEPGSFGLEIPGKDGGKWTVEIKSGGQVIVRKGFPEKPTFYFTMDLATLTKIYNGELNALTAAGRARISDPAPADIKFMEGAQPGPETMQKILHYAFHFFVLGTPEIILFDENHSRFVHGGNVVVFYYSRGLRTAWYQVKKGMVINKEEKDQINPFPTLFICIRGEGKARLGEKTITLKKGMMVYIPEGMSHMFWNEIEEPFEGIIIMFGEKA